MSNKRRVVVTGFGAISPLGNDWESVSAKLKSCTNAVQVMQEWGAVNAANLDGGSSTQGAPPPPLNSILASTTAKAPVAWAA